MSKSYVFIAASGEDKILTGLLDSETGHIEIINECEVLGGPELLVLDAKKEILYVGCHPRHYPKDVPPGDIKVYSYKVDWETGKLEEMNHVVLDFAPVYLIIDNKNKHLLSASYEDGYAAVHAIRENGEVGEVLQLFESGGGAHSIVLDPSGRFVFLPHITNSSKNMGTWPPIMSPRHVLASASNTTLVFKYDDETGRLEPNDPFMVAGERGGGPRHAWFHPNKDVVYFTNEQGCSVTAYDFDKEKGTITPFQYISALPPEGFDKYCSTSSLRVTNSGKFLYALTRGYNSIACYEIDPSTNRLTMKQSVKIDEVPREMGISLDDRYLFVAAGFESGQILSYRIEEDGTLTQVEAIGVGRRPMWVMNVSPEA